MYYLLFTSSHCQKCPSFKQLVSEKIHFEGKILDETSDNFMELAQSYGLSMAPTIVVFEDDSREKEFFRCSDESELISFIEKQCTLVESNN